MTAGSVVRETMQPVQSCPEASRRPLVLIHAADLPCATAALRASPSSLPPSSQPQLAATTLCAAGGAPTVAESTAATYSVVGEHARDLPHSECSSSTFTASTVLTQSQLPALVVTDTAPHAATAVATTTMTTSSTTIQSSLQLAQPERSAGFGEESGDSASFTQSGSRLSRCRLKMRSLAAPAFDLKRVEQVQESCLFEEVCNAALCHPLSRITKHVYLGTWRDASNLELLRQHGITYVLNVAKELSEYPEDTDDTTALKTQTVTLDMSRASAFGPSRTVEPSARCAATTANCGAPSSSSAAPSLRQLRLQQSSSLSASLPSTVRLDAASHVSDAGAARCGGEMVYATIPMTDCHRQDLFEHFEHAFEFIERARRCKGKVLVHCRRGISRSAAIVVAYLMASEQRSFDCALHHVMKRRQCVSLNLAFRELLAEYQPDRRWLHSRKRRHSTSQGQQPVLPCSGVCPAESRYLAALQRQDITANVFATPKTTTATACKAALGLTTALPSTPEEARELVKQSEECGAPGTGRDTRARSFRDAGAQVEGRGCDDGSASGSSSPTSSDVDSSCSSSADSQATNCSARRDMSTAVHDASKPVNADNSSGECDCGNRRARLERHECGVLQASPAPPPSRQPATTFFTVELSTPAVNAATGDGEEEKEGERVEEPGSPGRDLLLGHGARATRPGFAPPMSTCVAKESTRSSVGLVTCTPPCAEGGAITTAARATELPRRRCSPCVSATIPRGGLAAGSSPV